MIQMLRMTRMLVGCLIVLGTNSLVGFAQDSFDREPISYSTTAPHNAVTRLETQLAAGQVALLHDAKFGYLESVLEQLDVSVSSQTLVFSQTSLQRHRIRPRTPRALYFNDDVYVGYCHLGDVLEISVADPALGTVFYTLDQSPNQPPKFHRQTDSCLICHGGSQTRNVPGHLMRSVFPDSAGQPIFSSGTFRTNHTTPLQKRWGGWYVTGTHGDQTHLGNRIYQGQPRETDALDDTGFNVLDLSDRVRTTAYLSPHSDLVALMVLEHQAEGHNVLTRAAFDARSALHREALLNRELKLPETDRRESTQRILQSAADSLLNYFLMAEEAPLTAPVTGTARFARKFAARGPRDPLGRSLRDLDLQTRLFKYPCSYLIYTDSFDALPPELLDVFWQRLHDILTDDDWTDDAPPRTGFAHLTRTDRRAIHEILNATKPGYPLKR